MTVLLSPSLAAASSLEIPADLAFGGPRAQLLLLGTFHFKDAGLDGYKPKHDVDILSEEGQKQVAPSRAPNTPPPAGSGTEGDGGI